ncbi:MAG: LppX_LprAFG lipoprotein [Candidatus Dormiibacterota bacterium]
MKASPAAFLAVLLMASCGGGQQQTVNPVKTLQDAATAMAALKTVNANLKFTKGAVTFQGFTLVGAKASVRLPSDSDTNYTVKQQDLAIGLEVVITGGHVYLHLPFSSYQELTGAQAAAIPDVAKLFDPATGLPSVIPAGLSPRYAGASRVDGVDTYEVDATYSPDQLRSLLAQLSSSGDVRAQIWIGTSDHLIRKAVLDGPFGDGGKEASVEVDISGFNTAVNISPPPTS